MTYQLVFDSATANYEGWVFLPFGLLFVVIGCVLVFDRDFLADITPIWWRAVISWFFLLVSVVCTVLVTWGTVSDYFELRIASRNNTCTLVSGVVSEFSRRPSGRGATTESFSVDGVPFSFSDRQVSGGFHQTTAQGGPLREGVPVRICYVPGEWDDHDIVRLEILRPTP